MKFWDKIDTKLNHLESYQGLKEWERFFDIVQDIKEEDRLLKSCNSLDETEKSVHSYIIRVLTHNLEKIEQQYLQRIEPGDEKAEKALYSIVSMLLDEFIFTKSSDMTEKKKLLIEEMISVLVFHNHN